MVSTFRPVEVVDFSGSRFHDQKNISGSVLLFRNDLRFKSYNWLTTLYNIMVQSLYELWRLHFYRYIFKYIF